MAKLDGKIALVTGAGRGIGKAVALLLAREGARVAIAARTRSEIEAVADEIREQGGDALPVAGDVTGEAFVEGLFVRVKEWAGSLDILVNNAGIGTFGSITELPVAEYRRCLDVNIIGPFLCMQQAIRMMKEADTTGKIVNIGSVRSHWTESGDAGAYNASKYGLRSMVESVARELHTDGNRISVGMVCPGVVDTTLTNPDREPRPNWLTPETVAEAVLHAVTAPANINVYDTTLFSTEQTPW
jgi:NAD(P)-dependent dehydrogenase (short-subunit alcohol dehydrogenase family)